MALNMDKLRKKQEDLDKQGSNYEFWIPNSGKNLIRVLPPKGDRDVFYSEGKVHFNVGPDKKMVACLKNFKKKCPVCEAIEELKKSKTKEDDKLADDMRPVNRVYMNIIDRDADEDKEGVPQVYGCGNQVLKALIEIICDPDYGDITDLEEGRDVTLTKSGKNRNTEYKVLAKPKPSECMEDLDEKKLQEELPDLDALFVEKPYAELEALLMGEEYEEGGDDNEELEEDNDNNEDDGEEENNDDEDNNEDDGEENNDDEEETPPPAKNKNKSSSSKASSSKGSSNLKADIKAALNKNKNKK